MASSGIGTRFRLMMLVAICAVACSLVSLLHRGVRDHASYCDEIPDPVTDLGYVWGWPMPYMFDANASAGDGVLRSSDRFLGARFIMNCFSYVVVISILVVPLAYVFKLWFRLYGKQKAAEQDAAMIRRQNGVPALSVWESAKRECRRLIFFDLTSDGFRLEEIRDDDSPWYRITLVYVGNVSFHNRVEGKLIGDAVVIRRIKHPEKCWVIEFSELLPSCDAVRPFHVASTGVLVSFGGILDQKIERMRSR